MPRVRGIRKLVDRGHQIKSEVDELNSELEEIKLKIKDHSRSGKIRIIKGYKSKVYVGDSTQLFTNSRNVYNKMLLMGKTIDDFIGISKIVIGRLRDLFDEDEIKKLSTKKINEYSKVYFYLIDEEIPEKE